MRLLPAHFPSRHEHRTLAAMLLVLHVVIWWDFGSGTSRSLMLADIGLFLLWQPLLNSQQRLHWRALVSFAVFALAFVSALSWPLLGFWLLILIGLMGGRINIPRRQRYVYLLALIHLVMEFLIGWVPRMFAIDSPSIDFMELFRFGLFVPPVIVFFVPAEPSARASPELPGVDFIHGLSVALLSIVVALGSLVSTLTTGIAYPVALIQSVLAIAVFLLSVAWLWGPLAGFSGLGQLWERYVQNAGTPFELWLNDLQRTAHEARSPEQFLDLALQRMLALQWVAGIEWQDSQRSGTLGDTTSQNLFRSRSGDVRIRFHSHRRMGAALMLHARLLTQLIEHFYHAKLSEREMARQAHLRAIYETGSRLTHDIKNLLQALKAMTSAIEVADRRDPAAASALVRRQLPLITQRLQLSLDKLQAPTEAMNDTRMELASVWWQMLIARNDGQGVEFFNELPADSQIPVDLFDSVTENLIENARYKRHAQAQLRITVRLYATAGGAALLIGDDGMAIADEVKAELFTAVIESGNGLGIGLYQAARYAQEFGYRLRLRDELPGVVFELAPVNVEAETKPHAVQGDMHAEREGQGS